MKKVSLRAWIFGTGAALLLCGCQALLISQYDEDTDRGVSQLQSEVAEHLATLAVLADGPNGRPVSPDCKFKNFAETYAQLAAHAHVLMVRNEARYKNVQTTTQLSLLNDSLAHNLIAIHRDADGQCMTSGTITVAQQMLDQQFRAILTLELAKKKYRSAE